MSPGPIPPHLQHVVDEAKRNPYEAFASAAVALLVHDQQQAASDWAKRAPDPDCDHCHGDGYIYTGGTPVHSPEKAWCPDCYPEAWEGVDQD